MLHDALSEGGGGGGGGGGGSAIVAAAKLPHSHSTPAGVDGTGGGARTPPATPKKGGKMLAVRVQMLDDSVTMFQVQAKALGRVLFDQVCKQLHLLEADYFGLEYQDTCGTKYWLDLEKPMSRQVGLSLVDTLLRFCVKFYTPDPAQLEEEFTRYLYCLQIKRDLAQGLLQCNDNTAALMASYIVQAECGDYVVEDYPDHTYLSTYKFVPNQDPELERRIMENHKKHAGQSPAEADLNLLETSRRCELYGMKMHPAKDHEGVPLNLAVAHMGIVVFQNYTKINTFSWAKIRKISFKRKRFLIKLHPEGYGYYKDTVEFFFEGRNECKNFWKKCVENHGFFRCSSVKHVPRQKTRVLSRGSSFRYSGRTQKQIVEFVRENYVKRQTFQRSQSFRHTHSAPSSVASVGASLSAHPLLPLGENAVAGTPASLSCGSMTLASLTGTAERLRNRTPPTTAKTPARTTATGRRWRTCTTGTRAWTMRGRALRGRAPPRRSPAPSRRPPRLRPARSTSTRGADRPRRGPRGRRVLRALPRAPLLPSRVRRRRGRRRAARHPRRPRTTRTSGTPRACAAANSSSPRPRNSSSTTTGEIHSTTGSVSPALIENHHAHNNGDLGSPTSVDGDSIRSPICRLARVCVPIRPVNENGRLNPRKKRFPIDRAYFIAKEILMTERTYRKDLEVITVWFREEVGREASVPAVEQLLALLDPLHEAHCAFLREVETRLATWEGRSNAHLKGDYQRIGDVLLRNLLMLPLYEEYLACHLGVLQRLDEALGSSARFEQLYREFEQQKVCYLPLTAFVLKPLQRLLHYQLLLDRLLRHYTKDHPDYEDCYAAKNKLSATAQNVPAILKESENFVQLCELQRDMVGFDNLVQADRDFLRQGCLMKLSRKGYQQRMFFLFSDVLLYASRTAQPCVQFRVHGQLPLRGVLVEEAPDNRMGASFAFTIYGGNRALTVAASSQEEKDKWLEDLSVAVHAAKERGDNRLQYLSLKSCSSSDEVMDKCGEEGNANREKAPPVQRSNTTVHVCWHRNTSISMRDQLRAVENQLSGYLLRKFKNSNGWQKLWVVFTSFCLFFYKTFQDDFPLASLPLLGYTVTTPAPTDGIAKDYVFKLQFKNHVYFFRAESEYTFGRWMEVISSATQHSGRMRLFSRKDSALGEPQN